ncbi:MAG TPA: GDP-mannose 4,6-dehydratase [Planctomycetota bacterium]|nr:GDP-mannose 4,6-dehydratase [Planctomycetota bacterium]
MGSQRRALITGIGGQDGSYLAELLLSKGYAVHGVVRRSSTFNTERLDAIYQDPHETHRRLFLHYGDLTDSSSLRRILTIAEPQEVYNLGAQSHVRVSFDQPEYTADVVSVGTLRLLEAIRDTGRQVRFYQASSSEMFGDNPEVPQNEDTRFQPSSPYAAAKCAAFWYTQLYRKAYGFFACNGILFNHESPRRGETFVTRKITRAATRIKLGLQEKLYLGNLDASRDWGYAPEYAEAMWLMLQQEKPNDYVVATGETHTVREFLELVFQHLGLDWRKHVEFDKRYLRPAEVPMLKGDASRARKILGWRPRTDLAGLVRIMVQADMELARKEQAAKGVGNQVP